LKGFLFFCLFQFCAADSGAKRVLGQDRAVLVDETVLPLMKDLIFHLGLLQTESEACTMNYLGDGLVLTAGHCLKPTDCSSVQLSWLNENMILEKGGSCKRILSHFYEKNGFDYTIFEIEGQIPRRQMEIPDLLEIQDSLDVSTVGFRISEQSGNFDLIYQEKCSLSPLVTRPDLFSHNCDLGPSNSGSILFANGRPVGMHLRTSSGLNIAQPFKSMGAIF
jgi:hypothetical protein